MLSVRIKGSAVRIAIICGTETCGWLRTERDIEWKLWMKAVYAKHHRSQDAVRQNLHTTGKRFGVYLSQSQETFVKFYSIFNDVTGKN